MAAPTDKRVFSKRSQKQGFSDEIRNSISREMQISAHIKGVSHFSRNSLCLILLKLLLSYCKGLFSYSAHHFATCSSTQPSICEITTLP